MSEIVSEVIYQSVAILAIIYFVVLGCYMLMRQGDRMSTHGELKAKQRITCTVGISMMVVALLWFICIPPVLLGIPFGDPIHKVIFLVTLMCYTPVVYNVMFAMVQRRVNVMLCSCILGTPFFVLSVWQSLDMQSLIPVCIGGVLSVVANLLLLVLFAGEYRRYVSRIRSEYSDTTERDILWAWVSFAGFAAQGILYVVYMFFWMPQLDGIYLAVTVINTSVLCYCTCRQRTIDLDIVPEVESSTEPAADTTDNKAFYTEIEDRLKTMCEDKLLFLDPDITRETLCLRLAINRTYLSLYLRSREQTFYQYINTLRVEYAYRLMQDNPQMSIHEVSEQSGFRSLTTFRKAFQEVLGCLPSEVKRDK